MISSLPQHATAQRAGWQRQFQQLHVLLHVVQQQPSRCLVTLHASSRYPEDKYLCLV